MPAYGIHGRQIDHETAVARRIAREAVSTAAHGEKEFALARERYSAHDVSGVGATRDEGGVLVDHSVPNTARHVIPFLARREQSTPQARPQVLYRPPFERRLAACWLFGPRSRRPRWGRT